MFPNNPNCFLDFNGDGTVDASEEFMGLMIFQNLFSEDEHSDSDEDDD